MLEAEAAFSSCLARASMFNFLIFFRLTRTFLTWLKIKLAPLFCTGAMHLSDICFMINDDENDHVGDNDCMWFMINDDENDHIGENDDDPVRGWSYA